MARPGRGAWRACAAGARVLLALVVLLPFWGWLPAADSTGARLAVAGVFAWSLWRPADGLVATAGLFILGSPLGALLGASNLERPILLAFLGGWLLHDAVRGRAIGPARVGLIGRTCLFAAVIAAGIFVQALAAQPVDPPLGLPLLQVVADYARHYLATPELIGGAAPAGPMLEGYALFVAAICLLFNEAAWGRVARMAVLGAAALAALNLARFFAVLLRSGQPLFSAMRDAAGLRISVLGDYNAVGSSLAMMLVVAVAFCVVSRRTRIGWAVIVALVAVAIWLTGSRAAMLSAAVGLVALEGFCAGSTPIRSVAKRVAVVAGGLVVVLLLVARFLPPDAGRRPTVNMIEGRLEMARVSLALFRLEPVFGVGPGRFLPMSATYIAPRFRPTTPRENAHNNFLQILAEFGLVGLATFLWTLALVARRAREAIAERRNVLMAGAAAGVIAFLVTCLSGHPLLVPHACHGFWLMLGLVAAFPSAADARVTVQPVAHPSRQRRALQVRGPAVALLALVIVSVPLRANRLARAERDMSQVSSGFSEWTTGPDGVAYRTVTATARFYVRRDICRVVVPVRADGTPFPEVDVRLDGRLANRVRTSGSSWSPVTMQIPRRTSGDLFHSLQIDVAPRDASVHVGIVETQRCPPHSP